MVLSSEAIGLHHILMSCVGGTDLHADAVKGVITWVCAVGFVTRAGSS